MPLGQDPLEQLRALLHHTDPAIRAQGLELLVALARQPGALQGADLSRTNLGRVDLSGADLRSTRLTGAWLSDTDLRGADLRGANLSGARLLNTRLEGADLRGASMRCAHLSTPHLANTRLALLDLREATVVCRLPPESVVLINSRTRPARPWMLTARCLTSGASLAGIDLSGGSFSALSLEDADLSGANLSGASLHRARLNHTDLTGANLSGSRLHRARLRLAWLRGADLSGADLSVADLTGADLSGANLAGADLRGADLAGACLDGADLTGAKQDGVRRGALPIPGAIPVEVRMRALCNDPDWSVRRLALIHQARAGDRALALAGLAAAPPEHVASAKEALASVTSRSGRRPEPVVCPPDRACCWEVAMDAAGSDAARTLALRQAMAVQVIGDAERARLLTLAEDPGDQLPRRALDQLRWLLLDEPLLEVLIRVTRRRDAVGLAGVRALLTLAARHADAEPLDALIALARLPDDDPRAEPARLGAWGVLRDRGPRPDQDTLYGWLKELVWRKYQHSPYIQDLRTPRVTVPIDTRQLPVVLQMLWRTPGSPQLHALASDPDRALPIARQALTGPWGCRARVALRIAAILGPAAAELLPLIRPHLRRPAPDVQRAAAIALGAIGDPVALPWLAAASQTSYTRVKRATVRAMAALLHPDNA